MEQQLIEAVTAGNVEEVGRLLDREPALVTARAASGVSAILLAAYHGRLDIAQEFLARGAPLDIFEASALGHVDRIATLLGEDPSRVTAYSADGFFPLGLAAFFGHLEAVRALLAMGADVHAVARNPMQVQTIHAAAASRNVAIVKAVLEAGADPNARQQQGFLPLHEAGVNGNREMAELLVAHGADPRLADDSGKSIIDYAKEKGHAEMAEWMEHLVKP